MFALVSAALLGFLVETLAYHLKSLSLSTKKNYGRIVPYARILVVCALVLVVLLFLVLSPNYKIHGYQDAAVSALSGFFFGYLASLWGRTRHVSLHRTFVLITILVVGLVPNAGKEIRSFMVDAGIEELETRYFSLRLAPTEFVPELFDENESHSALPKPGFEFFKAVSESLVNRMEVDGKILGLLTDENAILQKKFEDQQEKIRMMFGSTITPLLMCVKDVRSHFQHQFEPGKLVEPLALAFSRLLSGRTSNIDGDAKRWQEEFTKIIAKLRNMRSEFRDSSPGDRNSVDPGNTSRKKTDPCLTTEENGPSFPDPDALKELVKQYPSYPYAAITLAALLQLAGSYATSQAVIEDWIEEHTKAGFDAWKDWMEELKKIKSDPETKLELLKRVNLVRAYSYLDVLESGRRREHMLQVKIGYIEALGVLSEELKRKGQLDVKNDCEKLDNAVLRRFVLVGILARNNFADEVSRAGGETHGRYGGMALKYAEEVKDFDVMKCLPEPWPSDFGRYLDAAFQDTFARVVYWDARHDREKRGERHKLVGEAEKAWGHALNRLERITDIRYRVTGDKLRDEIEGSLLQIRQTRNGQ